MELQLLAVFLVWLGCAWSTRWERMPTLREMAADVTVLNRMLERQGRRPSPRNAVRRQLRRAGLGEGNDLINVVLLIPAITALIGWQFLGTLGAGVLVSLLGIPIGVVIPWWVLGFVANRRQAAITQGLVPLATFIINTYNVGGATDARVMDLLVPVRQAKNGTKTYHPIFEGAIGRALMEAQIARVDLGRQWQDALAVGQRLLANPEADIFFSAWRRVIGSTSPAPSLDGAREQLVARVEFAAMAKTAQSATTASVWFLIFMALAGIWMSLSGVEDARHVLDTPAVQVVYFCAGCLLFMSVLALRWLGRLETLLKLVRV